MSSRVTTSPKVIPSRRVLNDKEYGKLINAVLQYRWGPDDILRRYLIHRDIFIISLLYETGMGSAQLSGLNEDNVTLENKGRFLTVLLHSNSTQFEPDGFLVLPEARESINGYSDLLREFKQSRGAQNEAALVVNREAERMDISSLDRLSPSLIKYSRKAGLEKADLENISFTLLRRSFRYRKEDL